MKKIEADAQLALIRESEIYLRIGYAKAFNIKDLYSLKITYQTLRVRNRGFQPYIHVVGPRIQSTLTPQGAIAYVALTNDTRVLWQGLS